jgi:hypothetical protein
MCFTFEYIFNIQLINFDFFLILVANNIIVKSIRITETLIHLNRNKFSFVSIHKYISIKQILITN